MTNCCIQCVSEAWSVRETTRGVAFWPYKSEESGPHERSIRLLVCILIQAKACIKLPLAVYTTEAYAAVAAWCLLEAD